ncbi:uncharacterized protein A1O9_11513 [Exophiala aquamarina CBS 119918]|uniref:Zinc finger Mcm10/DnaG-type domain-containing protein n=1 Tax=Exophiala aquamarina CBS 119918 TaxID=1182545 RepID=A0A072NZ54_9EURO|nr:uncharacterized protein A1O9_11513 [Exophiala aquamarina CBS 119918]KEF52273.1 hypothetical protein A1O9_11513 [Exophiala aquamarina CBS 119918]
MAHEASWPPHSPHAALLSSPSGRKKYEAMRTSPTKRSNTTPNLLDRVRAARGERNSEVNDDDGDGDDYDVEDDEEILQLKLAAIEAKLKLRKLQQSKSRAQTPARPLSRPGSSHGPSLSNVNAGQWHEKPTDSLTSIEVPLSPVRRLQPATQQKSPSRVLLGIDKGVRAVDVSLKRANTTSGARHRPRATLTSSNDRPSRSSAFNSSRSTTSAKSASEVERRKPFSERMAEARKSETDLSSRREAIARNRSKGFVIDHAELETYRSASEQSAVLDAQRSPTRLSQYVEYSREEVLHVVGQPSSGDRTLKKSRTMPNLRETPSRPTSVDSGSPSAQGGDPSLYEGFSQLHLSSRILPHSFLKRTLPADRFSTYRIPDLLREIKAPGYELPEEVCDYVIFGIIASKSGAMDHKQPATDDKTVSTKDWQRKWEDGSQNHRRFMAITLTDLAWSVDLYLFGNALPRYHRLSPGTVVAILNPGIMPPKPGREETGAFSLSLSGGDDTVLEIGTSRDLGFCKTPKKDGKECGSWVDASKTSICEWHLNAELTKAQSSRMGVNTGSNGFGANGLGVGGRSHFERGRNGRGGERGLKSEGQQYDRRTQSNFYISRSNTTGSKPGPNDARFTQSNPFGGQDHLDRNKDERIRRRFAAQEKEREIAEKLGGLGGNMGFGGAGAEYLRQTAQNSAQELSKDNRKKTRPGHPTYSNHGSTATTSQSGDPDKATQRSALATRSNLLYVPGSNSNGKRRAENVRLSPVKKTRFVTEKGIREAGRDSLGGASNLGGGGADSDDDLEIV